MSSAMDDVGDFVSGLMGVLAILIFVGLLFVNSTGMVVVSLIQAISQFIFSYTLPWWLVWIASIVLSYQAWFLTLWLVTNKFPAKKEWCEPIHYAHEQKAREWFNGVNCVLGVLYLLDIFKFKTGIAYYITKCYFGWFMK